MKFGIDLLARFGLFARKSARPDHFDLRLQRSLDRESRCPARAVLFRNQQSPLEV